MLAPKDWIDCPKKSYLIGQKFVCFKTPLDEKFKKKLKQSDLFTPDDVFDWISKSKLNLGLWIDLTKTTRYFNGDVVKKRGCKYEKIWCEGHGSVPDWKQIKTFTEIVDNFIAEHPDKIIGVHCTHGYNRTGYLIVTYLVNRMNFQIDDALKAFSSGRPPGIYREPYVKELVHRFGGDISKHFIVKPFWVKKDKTTNQVQIPLRLGTAEVARVIVPQEQIESLSHKTIEKNHPPIPAELQIRQSFGRTFRPPLEDETPQRDYRKRWRDFDRYNQRRTSQSRDHHRANFRDCNNKEKSWRNRRETQTHQDSGDTYRRDRYPSPSSYKSWRS